MSEIIVIAKVRVPAGSAVSVQKSQGRIRGVVENVPGFLGVTAWVHDIYDDCGLALYRYSSYEAAQEGLRKIVDGELETDMIEGTSTPHVNEINVVHRDGLNFEETPVGSFLSISERYAAPGHGQDLDEDLERVFSELRLGSGYLGSLRGYKVGLEEDRVGIVLWESRDAFEASLPNLPIYEVRLYRRVQ